MNKNKKAKALTAGIVTAILIVLIHLCVSSAYDAGYNSGRDDAIGAMPKCILFNYKGGMPSGEDIPDYSAGKFCHPLKNGYVASQKIEYRNGRCEVLYIEDAIPDRR